MSEHHGTWHIDFSTVLGIIGISIMLLVLVMVIEKSTDDRLTKLEKSSTYSQPQQNKK